MQLPQDIRARLERRWFARFNEALELRRATQVLNESEVTDEKTKGKGYAAHRAWLCGDGSVAHRFSPRRLSRTANGPAVLPGPAVHRKP